MTSGKQQALTAPKQIIHHKGTHHHVGSPVVMELQGLMCQVKLNQAKPG